MCSNKSQQRTDRCRLAINSEGGRQLCRLLALLYYQPDRETQQVLGSLSECMERHCMALFQRAVQLESSFVPNDLQRLNVAYAKLFVGPAELAAPPYGSVYLEDRRVVNGESTLAVRELYRQAGLEISRSEPADHIAFELEFLAYLGDTWEMEPERNRSIAQQMLERHLGAWVAEFADTVRESELSMFYSNLALLTRNTVQSLEIPPQ